jgi:hypothetical protein
MADGHLADQSSAAKQVDQARQKPETARQRAIYICTDAEEKEHYLLLTGCYGRMLIQMASDRLWSTGMQRACHSRYPTTSEFDLSNLSLSSLLQLDIVGVAWSGLSYSWALSYIMIAPLVGYGVVRFQFCVRVWLRRVTCIASTVWRETGKDCALNYSWFTLYNMHPPLMTHLPIGRP